VRSAAGDDCTVMLASHELDLARALCTREVRVVAGQVHPVPPGRPVAAAPVPPAGEMEASA
jgi:hypothetical protein